MVPHTHSHTWKRWSLNWWFYVINSQYIVCLMIWRTLVFKFVLQLHELHFMINKLMTKSWAGKYSLFKTSFETILMAFISGNSWFYCWFQRNGVMVVNTETVNPIWPYSRIFATNHHVFGGAWRRGEGDVDDDRAGSGWEGRRTGGRVIIEFLWWLPCHPPRSPSNDTRT